MTYRIRAWSETFLTDKTRGRKGRLRFVQMPVKLDDPDYIALVSGPDGATCLGVWLALVEAAGTLPGRDGVLARSDGRPLTLAELSAITRVQENALAIGISGLAEVGWLLSEGEGTIPKRSEMGSLSRVEGSLVEKNSPPTEGARKRAAKKAQKAEELPSVHKAMMAAIWNGYRAAFGAFPPKDSGGHWAKSVAGLRERGATPDEVRRAAEMFAVQVKDAGGRVPFTPEAFLSRFHALLNGKAATKHGELSEMHKRVLAEPLPEIPGWKDED